MIGSYKKWGTEGHIEKPFVKQYKKHKKNKKPNVKSRKQCEYKDMSGKCMLPTYINYGLACKRPSECHHFKKIVTQNGVETSITTSASVKSKSNVQKGEKMFPIGTTVNHIKFGNGVVKEVSSGRIIVEFSEGEKILGLEMCLKKGLITNGKDV